MREEKLEKSLNELADATAESVRPGLAEDIKQHIPHRLTSSRERMDTVNIIIDLRISRLAAAAVIIITMVLCVNFLGGRDSTAKSILQDSKLLMKYCLGGDSLSRANISTGISNLYKNLAQQGKDVVYYGDSVDPENGDVVLMQWKLPDGKYSVVLGNLTVKTVSAEELIKLQARMLQKQAK